MTNTAVKSLGIYIGHDKDECYNKNWMETYHVMEKLFESLKRRKLSVFGKCTIINTHALSKLIYIANIIELPDKKFIKDMNRLIYNFVWNKLTE